MSQVTDLLVSSARSIFETTVAKEVLDASESGRFAERAWAAIDDAGLDLSLVPEDRGGAGVSWRDAAAILRVAGGAAAPVPLADSMLARWLLAGCGLDADPGPLALAQLGDGAAGAGADGAASEGGAPRVERSGDGFRLSGTVASVPFARFAVAIVVPVASAEGPRLAVVPREQATIEEETNLAAEPRDTVRLDGVELSAAQVSEPTDAAAPARVRRLGAFACAALMSGALEQILTMTVEYARERIQFGRPIGQFQAVQQELAVLAGEVAAAGAAADACADTLDRGDEAAAALAVAATKARIGEAVGLATEIAHQVHGAIGFTHEHELHYRTRRLWAWRDECGSETWWSERVGEVMLAAGGAGLWPTLTGTARD